MEWWNQYQSDRLELRQARQVQDRFELHAARRWRLLRLRSDQKEGRYRIEFSRAGLTSDSGFPGQLALKEKPLFKKKKDQGKNPCLKNFVDLISRNIDLIL